MISFHWCVYHGVRLQINIQCTCNSGASSIGEQKSFYKTTNEADKTCHVMWLKMSEWNIVTFQLTIWRSYNSYERQRIHTDHFWSWIFYASSIEHWYVRISIACVGTSMTVQNGVLIDEWWCDIGWFICDWAVYFLRIDVDVMCPVDVALLPLILDNGCHFRKVNAKCAAFDLHYCNKEDDRPICFSNFSLWSHLRF